MGFRSWAAAAALAALSTPPLAHAAPPTTDAVATFQPGSCPALPWPVPALDDARCGTLIVPEDRDDPGGRKVRLPVAVLPALSDTPAPDPLVYMEGGPGGPALPTAQLLADLGLNADREVIVMGQRGSAFADPTLTCPEVDRFNERSAGLAYDAAATGRRMVTANAACRDRLVAQGIDLSDYDTTESAADFADLRLALGLDEWNVLGVSYGTDLALTYLRDHPEGVRSVTIDSVFPPDRASLGLMWVSSRAGVGAIFRDCAHQPSCHSRHPRPARTLARLVNRYEDHPLVGRVRPGLPGQDPGPGRVRAVVDGGGFATLVFGLTEIMAPQLPRLLGRLAAGDRSAERSLLAAYAFARTAYSGVYSFGLMNGVVCSEWVPGESERDLVAAGRQQFPRFPDSVLAQSPQFPFMHDICGAWPVEPAPSNQRAPTHSAVPTLVIGGTYDSYTSAGAAAAVAAALPRSTLVVVPGAGHFVLPKSACARDVLASFLDDPLTPDTTCVADLRPPRFDP